MSFAQSHAFAQETREEARACLDVIKKYVNSRTKIENFDEFLSSHGLKNLTIGRHLLSDEIKELFDNNNCTFILKETIINNNGAMI